MYRVLDPSDVTKAIVSAGRSGAPRPRIVTTEIMFDEAGNIVTMTVGVQQLHRKNGSDMQSLLGRQVQFLLEEELSKPKKKPRNRKS